MATLADYLRNHIPTRHSIHRYRLLRPFAKPLSQPNLWRLNHRSVPRAVALGLAVGVILPFLHMVVAALLAIPARANVAIAATTTLVVNPLTIVPLYAAAYHIGKWEMQRGADVDPAAAAQVTGEVARFLFWIHHASGPIALGILTIAVGSALVGYALSAFFWRHWITSQYRARRARRRQARRSSI
jgi:uncharacterized protein